jgi:alanine racemase
MLTVEINLKTISRNLEKIRKSLPARTKICAVVKANAYGMGEIKIAKHIEKFINCFGVAEIGEGLRLRKSGIKKDILLFGVCPDIKTAVENNIIITVGSLTEAAAARDTFARIHIAVNTDMNRYGCGSMLDFLSILKCLRGQKVEGLYTHFAFEDCDRPDKVDEASKKFQKYITSFKRHFEKGLIHAAASGNLYHKPTIAQTNMVRIGKAIYGGSHGFKTALTVKSTIVSVKKLRAGEGVGYNSKFVATTPIIIGIVAAGYADGIPFRFSGSTVTVDNIVCKIIGNICMDCFFIDASNVPAPLGKTITIIADKAGQTLTELHRKTGVIVCDILCGLNQTKLRTSWDLHS